MRGQKGITLVALILTIVVLLILAAVSINAIQDTQIINYANNAATKWNTQQGIENTLLGNYEAYLNSYSGTGSGSGTIEFTISYGENLLDSPDHPMVVCRAKAGMTWEEWVNSSYNTDGWEFAPYNAWIRLWIGEFVIDPDERWYGGLEQYTTGGAWVLSEWGQIQEGKVYVATNQKS